MKLFSTCTIGAVKLQNRVVMSPMTRSRATNNLPNSLMVSYYNQRSGAGLIITEGTSPSPNGLGYARIPGAFSAEQTAGWKQIAEAAHRGGAGIFMQLMHCGRVGSTLNLPAGAELVAPSAVALGGKIWTDSQGEQPYDQPREMTLKDIELAIAEYAQSDRKSVV